MTQQEIALRRFDVDDVIASQRLAGLEVDSSTLADLEKFVFGQMRLTDIILNAKARFIAFQHRVDY